MNIVRNRFGSISKVLFRCCESLSKELESSKVFQITKMLALIGVPASRQGENAFQVTADRKQRRSDSIGRAMGKGNKPTRTPNDLRRDRRHACTESSQRCRISRL